MYIGFILKRAINLLGVIAILLIACSVYKKYSPNDAPSHQTHHLQAGYACSSTHICEPATIIVGKITESVSRSVALNASAIKERGFLCFHSAGGSGSAMRGVSSTIRDHDIPTCMADYYRTPQGVITSNIEVDGTVITSGVCASACGFILISANSRTYIGEHPLIGVHSPATMLDLCFCNIHVPFLTRDHHKEIRLLAEMTEHRSRKDAITLLYNLSLETKSTSMHFLTHNQLSGLNMFNNTLPTN